MGKIDYKAIYDKNKNGWRDLTDDPQKYEALLAGHYSDSNHFIYELLQNAEDAFETNSEGVFDPATCAHASKVLIEYSNNYLTFYHNGKPFDEADVKGVSSMLMGTKDKDSGQTIGRFGMGFKSVFKYTNQPRIYSDEEAFKIKNYLLPVEIEGGWDFNTEKQKLSCRLSRNQSITPFFNDKHLTKIVIPFVKYGKDGSLCSVSGIEVLQKLKELNGEILLFLTHIKELYWINRDSGSYAHISKKINDEDNHLITCRIAGSALGDRVEISNYYLFKKRFDHEDMKNAEVSVAYKLNPRGDNINEITKSPVWVYFPTRDETDLPFIIHGSFETAVSREKLMVPSSFNDDLFDELGTLIAESMEVLAQKKLITQMFIRKILMASFEDEEENGTIIGLKDKITDVFKRIALLPCKDGEYRNPSELMVPVPFQIADFSNKKLIGKAIGQRQFVAINSEKETNFPAYFIWLTEDLGIPLFKLSDLASDLDVLREYRIPLTGFLLEELKEFYSFLTEFRESLYDTGLSYSRSGIYETTIKNDVGLAWIKLRIAPVILNGINQLSPAYAEGKPKIYLGSTSDYKKLLQSSLVHDSISKSFGLLLKDGFKIPEYDNFQYVKENVIQKYINDDGTLGFADNDNYEDEYAEDIKQILGLIDNAGNTDEIIKMLEKASVIKVKPDSPDDDFGTFDFPKNCYVPESTEGVNLNLLLAPVPYDGIDEKDLSDPDNWYDFDLSPIDVDFYNKYGIPISKLSKLGVVTSLIIDGVRSNTNDRGYYYWVAQGEYCPNIEIIGLEDNLNYIENYPNDEKAKEKSAELLKLLLKVSNKMQGIIKRKKTNPYDEEGEARVLSDIRKAAWLYDQDMNLMSPRKMSRYDLNRQLYDVDLTYRKAFEILGFIEKKIDGTEEVLQKMQSLDEQDKRRVLDNLAKELGVKLATQTADDDWDEFENNDVFNPDEYTDDEFPIRRVVNMDYLIRHVQEQFYLADTVKYEKVLMQIRTSKNTKVDKAYAQGMYTNSSNVTICQNCQRVTSMPRVHQISNYGIEMPQLNLCLCPECLARFEKVCYKNGFNESMRKKILSVNVETNSDEYSIFITDELNLHFTQTHIAEIQVILKLLSEYGLPNNDDSKTTVLLRAPEQTDAINQVVEEKTVSTDESRDKDVNKEQFSAINYDSPYDLDEGKVPVSLRRKAIDIPVRGVLTGWFYLVPYTGKLAQHTDKKTEAMFVPVSKGGKNIMIPISVIKEDRLIFMCEPHFIKHEVELGEPEGIEVLRTAKKKTDKFQTARNLMNSKRITSGKSLSDYCNNSSRIRLLEYDGDYKPFAEALVHTLDYLSERYEIRLSYDHFTTPANSRDNELLFKIFHHGIDVMWVYFLYGKTRRDAQYISIEVDDRYIHGIKDKLRGFIKKIERSSFPNCKFEYRDFNQIRQSLVNICDAIDKKLK